MAPRPIIIVTGANSGVGFGICHRLLVNLSQKLPPDAHPQFKSLSPKVTPLDTAPTETYDGLTLIMACRSGSKALSAKQQLLELLDKHIVEERKKPDYDGHAERFRENLEINYHYVDMSILRTVFAFGHEISQKYPYISHLICNAGCAFWTGVDKFWAIWQMLTQSPLRAVTLPNYKLQQVGKMSVDGLGATWQSNIFGHYVMYRYLQPLFTSYAQKFNIPARLIWTGSLEGQSCWYSHDDWQLIKSDHSYEGSKYELDLIASYLSKRSMQPGGEKDVVRHYIVHPGVVHSNMTNGMVNVFFDMLKVIIFYIVRLCGSPNHLWSSYEAAVSAVHIALVSIVAIPSGLLGFAHIATPSFPSPAPTLWDDASTSLKLYTDGVQQAQKAKVAEQSGKDVPLKYGAMTDAWGRDYVGATPILDWDKHEREGEFLVQRCEELYQKFLKTESVKVEKAI